LVRGAALLKSHRPITQQRYSLSLDFL